MSLKNCPECNGVVSSKAESCPKCGCVLKKKKSSTGCGTGCFAVILLLLFIGFIGSLFDEGVDNSASSPSRTSRSTVDPNRIVSSRTKPSGSSYSTSNENKKIFKEGETASIGYTSYAVWSSWWSSDLSSNPYLNEKPDAMFLFVDLTVRNNDKKARSIPPFNLIDEKGYEYEASSKALAVEGAIGVLDSLNPDVSKKGFVVFDVPVNHTYKLKISGGYWSSEEALIELSPKQ